LKEILEVESSSFLEFGILRFEISILNGGLAQLARAPALHAGGHRFDSDILHHSSDTREIGIKTTKDTVRSKIVFYAIDYVLYIRKTFIDILRIRIREYK
jgi:hypothetical protein